MIYHAPRVQDEMHYDQGKWDCLPPPGNTMDINNPHSCIQQTEKGRDMSTWISSQLTVKHQSQQIWDNLKMTEEAVTTRRYQPPTLPIHSPDIPVPIYLADHLPEKDHQLSTNAPADTFSIELGHSADDIDDLIMPWTKDTAPSLEALRELSHGLPDRLLYPTGDLCPDTIEVYADGSFDNKDAEHERVATWALAICGKKDGTTYLLDWYGAAVVDDPLDLHWMGATQQHIREAEATALAWTACYLIAHYLHECTTIYSDALSVLNVAKGIWTARPEEHLCVRLRALFQVLRKLKPQEQLYCRHVKSHSGILGNELADGIANALREGIIPYRHPPRHYAWWLHGDPPRINRAYILIDAMSRQDVPQIHDTFWHYGGPTFPAQAPQWLDLPEECECDIGIKLKIASYNVNTLRHTGAVSMLREQCHAQGIHLIGLQETRTPDAVTYDTDYIRYVGRARQGHGGVELWVSSTMSLTGAGDTFRRSDATVLHEEAEIIIVALQFSGKPLLCVVAHAPHRGHPTDVIQDWWNQLRALLRQHRRHRPLILMIDANASIGPHAPHIGECDGQPFDSGGTEMLRLLQEQHLFVPSTFTTIHRGLSATWHSSKTVNEGHRNDYIVIDLDFWPHCLESKVNYNIDAGNQALDHTAVQVIVEWKAAKRRTRNNRTNWDRNKLQKADEDTWRAFFCDWPEVPWSTDVTTHMDILERHLQQQLQHFFPLEHTTKRHSCLDLSTTALIQQRYQLKKLLSNAKIQCQKHALQTAFKTWKSPSTRSALLKEFVCVLRTTWRWQRYKDLCHRVRAQVAQTRAQWLEDQLKPLQAANKTNALTILKPLRMGKRVRDLGKKPLQQVRLPDDTLANTPQEATTRWRDYFAELEGGQPTDYQTLWSKAKDAAQRPFTPPERIEEVPTLLEVERQLQKAATGKAVGYDRLPGELLKHGAPWLASAIWPLVAKAALWGVEPLQHKGGKLVVAYKNRGDHTQCHNHRGLLVSSSLSKALHNVWRARTQPLVTQAAHCVRLYMRGHMAHGYSCYALMLDIQAAYYRLLRQHSINSDFSDESLILFLRRMGVDDITVPDLAHILQGRNALEELQCPKHLQRVVSSLHDSTWWRLDVDRVVIKTERGTRPGDGFADVVWQLCFSRYLHRLDDILESLGIQTHLWWNGLKGFDTSSGPHDVNIGTVVWADDAAIMGANQDADRIVPQLQVTAEVVLSELVKLGMRPNMTKGKTEALLHIQGKGCKKIRQFVHHHCKSKIQLAMDDPELQTLRVVPTYIHLGGALTHDNRMRSEIRRKLAMANTTLDNYRSKVLHNPQVPLTMRVHIFRATVAMVLDYNLGTWPSLSQGDQTLWRGGVMRLYRRLLARHYSKEEQFHMPEDRLLSILQLPHPDELLHAARLRQFAMCTTRHNRQFWALVAFDQDWLNQVREAAQWSYTQIRGHTVLPSPDDHDALRQWTDYMMTQGPKFKRVMKRAAYHALLQRAIHADVHHFHDRILKILQQGGLQCTVAVRQRHDEDRQHVCLICGTGWSTYRSWAVHSFKSHGRLSAYRQLQLGTRCESCGRKFSNNARLTRHFRSVPRCAATLAAQQRWEAPQPATGNRQVTDALPYDSMIPYIDEEGPTLQHRNGWTMTNAMLQALKALSHIDWTLVDKEALQDLTNSLRQLPLHEKEFDELIQAKRTYYAGDETADTELSTFAISFSRFFTHQKEEPRQEEPQKEDIKPDHLQDLTTFRFHQETAALRGHPRFYYVVHLFAGVKRKGDVHSFVASLECPQGGLFFPISLDVMLDPVKGDLLSEEAQSMWLNMALRGLIYATIAGPPCETWSVSRWRQVEGDGGPRPLRSTNCLYTLIWALAPLRIKELCQLTVGNKLLHYSLMMMAAQCIMGNIGLLEHPSTPAARKEGVPPSIWRLPIMQLLRRHPNIGMVHIKQGYFGSVSPKPTTLLLACDPKVRSKMIKALLHGQTTTVLPPPLKMKKTDRGFSTLPLKRYPPGLCRAIAAMLYEGLPAAPSLGCEPDGISELAEHFHAAYLTTEENGQDGQDYCQKSKKD